MQLKIITHERIVFEGEVDELVIQTKSGQMGIMKDHIPLTTSLDIGVTKVKQGANVKFFTTMGGVLQFKDGECTILTTTAEAGNDIDVARAEAALRRAKQRLEDNDAAIDSKRAEAAVARAMARLKATLNN